MDYSDNSKSIEHNNITCKDIINFFAEYVNTNNLGLIADAHLAHYDSDPKGANGEIPKSLAKKFSLAVDAPKTGAKITMNDDEETKSFQHYMGKDRNSYHSDHIMGKLYGKTVNYIDQMDKYKHSNKFYDETLLLPNYKNFKFEALIYFI